MTAVQSRRDAALTLPSVAARPAEARRWLFSPLVDGLCLGGASLIALPLFWLLVPASAMASAAAVAMALAHLVNHPHFAHSYQIFYSGFRAKAFGEGFDAALRWRYRVAGLLVPLALAGFLLAAALARDLATLGLAVNLMFLLVGWHYAKQGYGIAILDSVLKRRFYDAGDKRALLLHAYACWALSWLAANRYAASYDFWGLRYVTFQVPAVFYWAGLAAVAVSGLWLLWRLAWRLAERRGLAWTGLMAYGAALYPWLLLVRLEPVFLLFVPAFHSLQYLVVVWRYKLNEAGSERGLTPFGWLRLASFLLVGGALGWALFWGLPRFLDGSIAYDQALFGPALFLFAFWIFVNVHHYFLDNVMWRRGNPETRRHLFGG